MGRRGFAGPCFLWGRNLARAAAQLNRGERIWYTEVSNGQVAQLVERSPEKAGVGGSIPSLATTKLNNLNWLRTIEGPPPRAALIDKSSIRGRERRFRPGA
jgi:hypothetical protein